MRNVDYTFQVICVADIEIREWLLASLLLLSKPAEQFPKLHFALFSLGLHAVVESELEKKIDQYFHRHHLICITAIFSWI